MTDRALVLGGGGFTGVSWMWGMLAGLVERGIDLRAADLVVGTSAGSVVGAQVASGLDVEERYAAQLRPLADEVPVSLPLLRKLRFGAALFGDAAAARRRIAAIALRVPTVPEEERLRLIGDRLLVTAWPDRELKVTAVDTATGELTVFERSSGVALRQAVTASCAVPGVWPPITVNGRRYVDGGLRSPANADLAAGYARVVVLAPIPRGIGPIPGVERQVAQLREHSRVALVSPDGASRAAIGRNALDPGRRPRAARAGRRQARAVAAELRAVWEV
ncbi:patatin-like phospholipase family protein [Pseudonocardia sp.]|uniref:patatin-like phospholipase family protein n=1 Tax=Pseudonocardia sp. TaxID=60912 RepID=UPI003D111E21